MKKPKRPKAFEPCPHGKTEAHNCAGVIRAGELIGIADEYLTVACDLTGYAKDATSQNGQERLARALAFSQRILKLAGVTK